MFNFDRYKRMVKSTKEIYQPFVLFASLERIYIAMIS